MFNVDTVQQSLKTLLAFKQTRTSDIELLKDFLLTSDSGQYYEDVHPLVNIVNIDASCPDYDSYVTPDYSGSTEYIKGQIVKDTTFFRSKKGTVLVPNVGKLTSDTEWWEPFGYLSGYLEDVILGAIPKVIKQTFAAKKKAQNTKELFADLALYQGSGNMSSRIVKADRFCGFEIEFKYMKDLVMSIKKIGIQTDTLQNPLTIYIYHSSQTEAIYTFDIDVTKAISFGWYELTDSNGNNPVLNFVNSSLNAGGSFYIGYYEDEVTGQFVKNPVDLSVAPCGGCSPVNQTLYKNWNQYISIHPFSVADDYLDLDGRTLWDISKNSYTYDTNWGLNLSLNLKCDLTDFIVRNKTLFTDALGLQVAHDLIYAMAYSTENNAIAEKNRKLALYELDDRENNTQGLMTQLKLMYEALNIDLSSLNSRCLPPPTKNGVTMSAI